MRPQREVRNSRNLYIYVELCYNIRAEYFLKYSEVRNQ